MRPALAAIIEPAALPGSTDRSRTALRCASPNANAIRRPIGIVVPPTPR